jgi:hypothetical protein
MDRDITIYASEILAARRSQGLLDPRSVEALAAANVTLEPRVRPREPDDESMN